MKKRLIFGIIGFLISFLSIFFFIGPAHTEKDFKEPTYEEAINGWVALGDILSVKLAEPVSLDDEIFVSILMEEFITNIYNKPRIIITSNNHIILWDTEQRNIRKKYNGWKISKDEQEFIVTDSVSIVGTPIKVEGRNAGYVYIKFKNEPLPKDISNAGWKSYASILSYSIREEIDSKNLSKIANTIKNTPNKNDLLELTVLARDKTILWDMDNAQIGKDYIKGWIDKAKSEQVNEDKSYLYVPVDFQGRRTGEMHFLITLPISRIIVKSKPILGIFPTSLFKINSLIFPIISFILLFIIGGFVTKAGLAIPREGIITKATIQKQADELDVLRGDMERLRIEREKLVSEIADKQKEKKDLERDIGTLVEAKEAKEYLPKDEAEGTAVTEEEEEKLLFDRLFKDEGPTSEKGKEELELTQRIVSKRREEIALSARVDAKRKELIDLQRNIDDAKRKLEKYE